MKRTPNNDEISAWFMFRELDSCPHPLPGDFLRFFRKFDTAIKDRTKLLRSLARSYDDFANQFFVP